MFSFGLTDIIDILLVSFLLYYIYSLMRETRSANVFSGIIIFVMVWLLVTHVFNMRLLGGIVDEVNADWESGRLFMSRESLAPVLAMERAENRIDEFVPDEEVRSNARVIMMVALDEYAKKVNDTKDTSKAAETSEKLLKEYVAANGMEESSIATSTGIRNETNVDKEVDKVIAELGEGKAKTIKVGKGENANYYYVFRYNMQAAKDDYLTPGTNDDTIISKMKQKDFQKYLKDLAADLKHDRSNSVDSYKPGMFFVAKEPETTAAST